MLPNKSKGVFQIKTQKKKKKKKKKQQQQQQQHYEHKY